MGLIKHVPSFIIPTLSQPGESMLASGDRFLVSRLESTTSPALLLVGPSQSINDISLCSPWPTPRDNLMDLGLKQQRVFKSKSSWQWVVTDLGAMQKNWVVIGGRNKKIGKASFWKEILLGRSDHGMTHPFFHFSRWSLTADLRVGVPIKDQVNYVTWKNSLPKAPNHPGWPLGVTLFIIHAQEVVEITNNTPRKLGYPMEGFDQTPRFLSSTGVGDAIEIR